MNWIKEVWMWVLSVLGFLVVAWPLVIIWLQKKKFDSFLEKGIPWFSAMWATLMGWPVAVLAVIVGFFLVFSIAVPFLEKEGTEAMTQSQTGDKIANFVENAESWGQGGSGESEGGENPPEGGEEPPEDEAPPEGEGSGEGDEPAGTAVPERVLKPESEWVSCLASHYDSDAIVVGNSPRWGQVQTVAAHIPNGLYATLYWNHPNLKKNFGVLHLPYGPTLNLDRDVADPWKEAGTRLDSHPSDSGHTKVFKVTGVGPWPDSCFETSETPTPDAADETTSSLEDVRFDPTPLKDSDYLVCGYASASGNKYDVVLVCDEAGMPLGSFDFPPEDLVPVEGEKLPEVPAVEETGFLVFSREFG